MKDQHPHTCRIDRVATLLLWMIAPLAVAEALPESPEVRGDRAWDRRGARFLERGAVDPRPVATAVLAYEEALASAPEVLRLHFKLMEAVYFQACFTTEGAHDQKQAYERLTELAERAVQHVEERTGRAQELPRLTPKARAEILRQQAEAPEAYFWGAVSWGLWGMSHSRLSSASKGVAERIRDHAEMVMLLEEGHRDGGGLRLLGRLHSITPRVIFFTGWINREQGIALLRRALVVSRKDPRNLFFLAEALLARGDKEGRKEALALLRELDGRSPDPEHLVVQSETFAQAREQLRRLEGS